MSFDNRFAWIIVDLSESKSDHSMNFTGSSFLARDLHFGNSHWDHHEGGWRDHVPFVLAIVIKQKRICSRKQIYLFDMSWVDLTWLQHIALLKQCFASCTICLPRKCKKAREKMIDMDETCNAMLNEVNRIKATSCVRARDIVQQATRLETQFSYYSRSTRKLKSIRENLSRAMVIGNVIMLTGLFAVVNG